jgi:hypothetical protein
MRFVERLALGRMGVFAPIERQIMYRTMVTAAAIPREAGAGRRWMQAGAMQTGGESAVARLSLASFCASPRRSALRPAQGSAPGQANDQQQRKQNSKKGTPLTR